MCNAGLLDVVHVDNVGVDIELELLALGRGLAGVLGVEDGVEFLELKKSALVCGIRGKGGDRHTVRFLVSGTKYQMIPAWTAHHTKKTM